MVSTTAYIRVSKDKKTMENFCLADNISSKAVCGRCKAPNTKKRGRPIGRPLIIYCSLGLFSLLAAALALAGDAVPYGSCESATYERSSDEYPYILEGFATYEESGSE